MDGGGHTQSFSKSKVIVGIWKLVTCCTEQNCFRNQRSVEIKGSKYNEIIIFFTKEKQHCTVKRWFHRTRPPLDVEEVRAGHGRSNFKDTNPLNVVFTGNFCLGWGSNFIGSESGQKQSVKLLQNMVYNTTQHPHTCRGAAVHKYSSFVHGGNSSQAGSKILTVSECIFCLYNLLNTMPQSLLTGQFWRNSTFRVRCLYSSFVHVAGEVTPATLPTIIEIDTLE